MMPGFIALGHKPAGSTVIAWRVSPIPVVVTPTRERYVCGCEWFADDARGLWEPCPLHGAHPLTKESL